MKTLAEVEAAARDLRSRVDVACTIEGPIPASALADATFLHGQSWAQKAGVYVVLEGTGVRYVGRALKGNTLAGRLREHLLAPGSRVGRALAHPDAQVSVLPLRDEDAWLAPSLELLVLSHVRADGILNLRRS